MHALHHQSNARSTVRVFAALARDSNVRSDGKRTDTKYRLIHEEGVPSSSDDLGKVQKGEGES